MKTLKNVSIAVMLMALLICARTGYAQNHETSTDYSVISRYDMSPRPVGFLPTKATPTNGAYNENVATVSNRVLNEDTHMLKKATVQPVGEEEFSAWQVLCDEGGDTYEQSALNPLSYMLGGISSSLLTHVEQAIMFLDLDVASAKVEAKISFRYDDPMTPKWSGYSDELVANILIESDEPAEKIADVKRLAVQAWAIGECITNPTPVDAKFEYNDKIWDVEYARQGQVIGSDSYDNNLKLTSKGNKLKPVSLELGPDVGMDLTVNPFKFNVVGLAESAQDPHRPHLHKLSVRSINNGYAAWNIYADDSRGYAGVDKAPSSNDYFSVGTTLCLMSQLTGSQMIHKKQGINISDFRAEHQFNFQIDNYMTPSALGHVDGVTTRILVKGDATEEEMSNFASMALRMCFAGEAVTGSTQTEIGVYQNGKLVE